MRYTPDPSLVIESVKAALEVGQQVEIRISSNSMLPLIKKDDFISIVPGIFDTLEVGAIITLENDGKLLTHRLIQKDLVQGKSITKGDHTRTCDPPCSPDQFIGIVIKRDRSGHLLDLTSGHGYIVNRFAFRLSQMEYLVSQNRIIKNYFPYYHLLFRGLVRLISYLV